MTETEEKQYDGMITAFYGDSVIEEKNEDVVETIETEVKEEEEVAEKVAEIKEEIAEIKNEEVVEVEKPKRWDESLDDNGRFILDKLSKGEDKEVYELLKNKYGYSSLSSEEKALAYLSEKNPFLDKEDIMFKLANEYGVGVDPLSQEDLEDLTDSQKREIKSQELKRKELFNEVNGYFNSKATNIEIPSLPNPLDEDEGYKEYKNYKEEQVKLKEQQAQQAEADAKFEREINERIDKTALEISALPLEFKIDIDKSEFALKSDFKLDDGKQKQLAEYAREYVPTQAEIKAHQNQNGELDMKGYMTALASRLFAPQIQKALIKQAIAQDREVFTERHLKNSTLRNNDNQHQVDVPVEDFYIAAMRK